MQPDLYLSPIPCQKVMSNGFQVYKRIVIFYKFKQLYCALLVGMVHNKEVHGVILKKKWKQLNSLQQSVWLSSPALRQPRAQGSCWVWCISLMALQRHRDQYPHSARWLCNHIQISSCFSPRLALQGTALLIIDFCYFFQGRKKQPPYPYTQTTGFCNLWNSPSQLEEGFVAKAVCLGFVYHIPWQSGRSILPLHSVQGCCPSAQPFW